MCFLGILGFILLVLSPTLPLLAQMSDSNSGKSTPTVFQAEEGDRWMLLGDKPLIFKVDPVSTGSDTLVVGTEEMPPGNRIPTHKHLYEDEVIFVHKRAGACHAGWPSVRGKNGSDCIHSSWELDRSRKCFQ